MYFQMLLKLLTSTIKANLTGGSGTEGPTLGVLLDPVQTGGDAGVDSGVVGIGATGSPGDDADQCSSAVVEGNEGTCSKGK